MTTPAQERPPYLWAFGTFLVVFLIYFVTLAPTTAFWDTSEYISAARVLGIPHPPGNPLFVILAHTFGLLPLAASYAERINLFAAVTSAAAAGLWFLVAERWLKGIVRERWARYAAAFGGVLVGATSWSVWNQSTVNEKVYTVSLFSIALVMWLVVRWGDDAPGPHRDRWLVLIAYVLALTSTNHLMGLLAVPALVVYVLWTDWRVITRPTVLVGIVLAAVVGISLNYLWLPMRAAQYPPINEGEPIGFFSQALKDVLNRVQYGKPGLGDRQASFSGQLGTFWQYYSWQFARDWGRLSGVATAVFTVLGVSGLWALWKSDRRAGLAGLALVGTLSLGLVFYMNFKYGFSQYPNQPSLPREVRERDYFFIGSFAVYGAFVACGLGALMQSIVDGLRDRGSATSRWAAASPVLLLAFVPLFGNRVTASRAHETMARDFAYDILNSVEPYGILITAGDNDTFPLWYAQEVEGIRPDITLANLSLMNTNWHLRQLARRVTPAFDPNRADPIWRNVPVPPHPTTPALALTQAEVDSLPEAMQVPKTGGIAFDSLQIRFGQDVLLRQDLASIFLIRDNQGKRPIFFSWSDGGYPDQTLGLSQYLVSQGFVRKLMPTPVRPTETVQLSPGLGYVDVPRTRTLLSNVYHWQTATRRRPFGWVDAPSGSILQLYAVVYGGSARVFEQVGDTARAMLADSVAREVNRELTGRAID
jgi:transmembrane protein TMEM260 (protein O-mannosyltransferase)